MKTNCCDCCYPAIVDEKACGCCEGIEIVTPLSTYNRPGLSEISYRIGTHAGFLETMTARLTGYYLEKQDEQGNTRKVYPLKGLTTRDAGDPSLALLDAWATVADVLTFYQERIANEGYLRTATERRSIVELARLVGYKPRPGVAASVFLAYSIDPNTKEEVVIPAGSRSQSIPGPDELPQSFETSDALKARAQWNNLKPRLAQAQTRDTIESGSRIYLKGLGTNVKVNDALLIDFDDGQPLFIQAYDVLPENEWDRTLVTFIEQSPPPFNIVPVVDIIHQLVLPASIQPANQFQLRQSLAGQFALQNNAFLKPLGSGFGISALSATAISSRPAAQAGYSVLGAFSPVLKNHLATATASVKLTAKNIKVFQLGVKASLFGHNLPLPVNGECLSAAVNDDPVIVVSEIAAPDQENLRILALDAEYQNIKIGADVAVKTGLAAPLFAKVAAVNTITLGGAQTGDFADYSFFSTCPTITSVTIDGEPTVTVAEPIKMKVTVLTLDSDWRAPGAANSIIKNTTVYIQNGNPELAEEPITKPVCGGTDETIELDGFYSDLEAGRWVIVSGERDEVAGVKFSELALLASVTHDIATGLPDENLHTYIQLAEKLAYCFKRETVTIHGNVVKATHGETRLEVLGSGDGARALQTFALKQTPLTHASAANPSGIDSTLKVFVNNIQWHEANSLAGLQAGDRAFISKTDNDDKTSVTFGNGRQGSRLPTGVENIRSEYRNGIGKAGNVKAEQISLLLTKPLGVKEVINPLRASGGADRESRDQARQHIPLAVKALDRLVSTQDYGDFSRVYAGIGKAYAIELSDGRLPLIHVTIAGAGDIPIDETSDLFRNLRQALHDFGDPFQKIQLAVRELLMIVIEAGLAILPDYQWEPVVTEVRAALLDHFSFERRELGQDVVLSEVISVMQSVEGVAYADVDSFGGVPEKQPLTEAEIQILTDDGTLPLADPRRLLTPDEIADEVSKIVNRIQNLSEDQIRDLSDSGKFRVPQRLAVNLPVQDKFIRPAQLAFLSPDVPATLILNQIK